MNHKEIIRTTGMFLISLVVLSNLPYTLLIQNFEYDDILRQPIDVVLTKFQAGGTSLILTWFAFALTALLLVPVSILLHRVIYSSLSGDRNFLCLSVATTMGIISGVLQAIGLLRWVFVVPILANIYTASNSNAVTRQAVSVVYQAVHQYGGVVVGEFLGQTLLIGWTVGICWVIRSSSLFRSWVSWLGLFSTFLLMLGQSELLATVVSGMPVIETTPIGFILWEFWLLSVGISLLLVSRKGFVFQP
jgi:hypothetical protein